MHVITVEHVSFQAIYPTPSYIPIITYTCLVAGLFFLENHIILLISSNKLYQIPVYCAQTLLSCQAQPNHDCLVQNTTQSVEAKLYDLKIDNRVEYFVNHGIDHIRFQSIVPRLSYLARHSLTMTAWFRILPRARSKVI